MRKIAIFVTSPRIGTSEFCRFRSRCRAHERTWRIFRGTLRRSSVLSLSHTVRESGISEYKRASKFPIRFIHFALRNVPGVNYIPSRYLPQLPKKANIMEAKSWVMSGQGGHKKSILQAKFLQKRYSCSVTFITFVEKVILSPQMKTTFFI